MKRNLPLSILQLFAAFCVLPILAAHCVAQSVSEQPAAIPALLLSDIHFEPFWDPAKVQQLATAPASQWKAILAAPASADQAQRFAALQQSCHARGVDTSYPLFTSSLNAERAHAAGIKFITVSGDLISHSFSCKYAALFPHSTRADYRAFVEKTIEYVIDSLRETFPGVPVYAALGNNDSDCNDYQLDVHSDFLLATGRIMTAGLPAEEQKEALATFAAGGYYSASLPLPHARILVLDDLFMATKYATCGGKPDPAAASDQIAWVRRQLERARREKEKIWIMAHIPPGIDPYSTAIKGNNICEGKSPQMFLSSEALPDALAGFGDVIQLAIFAHTHMDEIRLLKPVQTGSSHGAIAVKMVSSISPVNGNNPSFTIAQIDSGTAQLVDYRVFAASNRTGIGAAWTEEYDYARAYREPSFSAVSLTGLIGEFKADPSAQSQASRNYLRNYYVGDRSDEIKTFWPQYVCALANHTADSYRACVCAKVP